MWGGGPGEGAVPGRLGARVVPPRRGRGGGVKEGIGVVRWIGGVVGSSSIAGMVVVGGVDGGDVVFPGSDRLYG